MRLANESVVRIGSATVSLRPTLRAATQLERRYGGFDKLLGAISDGAVSAMCDVIEFSSERTDALALFSVPLGGVLPQLIDKLAAHVLCLAGVDRTENKPPQLASGKRISFAHYHANLYRIAAGWLGWLPTQAWDATPAEILEAYAGHLEMLRAIHGGAEPENNAPRTPDDSKLDRTGLNRLKALSGGV